MAKRNRNKKRVYATEQDLVNAYHRARKARGGREPTKAAIAREAGIAGNTLYNILARRRQAGKTGMPWAEKGLMAEVAANAKAKEFGKRVKKEIESKRSGIGFGFEPAEVQHMDGIEPEPEVEVEPASKEFAHPEHSEAFKAANNAAARLFRNFPEVESVTFTRGMNPRMQLRMTVEVYGGRID